MYRRHPPWHQAAPRFARGFAGFCPGPGLVALGMGEGKALVFTAAMLTGMIVFEGIERRKSLRAEPAI
ncbi:DUF6691 family protein [Acidovorax soli]|uniref:DUF6691 family protein n=1 Tax=Acidovorax soli TaxID=592050 RepID=UPI003CC7A181